MIFPYMETQACCSLQVLENKNPLFICCSQICMMTQKKFQVVLTHSVCKFGQSKAKLCASQEGFCFQNFCLPFRIWLQWKWWWLWCWEEGMSVCYLSFLQRKMSPTKSSKSKTPFNGYLSLPHLAFYVLLVWMNDRKLRIRRDCRIRSIMRCFYIVNLCYDCFTFIADAHKHFLLSSTNQRQAQHDKATF